MGLKEERAHRRTGGFFPIYFQKLHVHNIYRLTYFFICLVYVVVCTYEQKVWKFVAILCNLLFIQQINQSRDLVDRLLGRPNKMRGRRVCFVHRVPGWCTCTYIHTYMQQNLHRQFLPMHTFLGSASGLEERLHSTFNAHQITTRDRVQYITLCDKLLCLA